MQILGMSRRHNLQSSDSASEAFSTQHSIWPSPEVYIFMLKMGPGVVKHQYFSNPMGEKEAKPFALPSTSCYVEVRDGLYPLLENAGLGAGGEGWCFWSPRLALVCSWTN